jgi:hypothetical protein
MPPLPFNPYPELPVVEIAPGMFLVDDTGLPETPEQAEARKRWQQAIALAKAIANDPVRAAAAQRAAEERARLAQEAWEKRKAELAPQMRALIPPGQSWSDEARQAIEAEFAALRERAARSAAEQAAKEKALDELSERLGTPREIVWPDGRKLILAGEIAGSPVFLMSPDPVAAVGDGAVELWLAGVWPDSDSDTGRNLTGTNMTLPLREVDGGVLPGWAYNSIPKASITARPVPEPSAWALLVGGGLAMVWFRQKRNPRMG